MAAPAAAGGAAQVINQVLPDAIGQVINNEEFRRIEGENRRGQNVGPNYQEYNQENVRGRNAAQNLMTQILLNLAGRNQGTQYRSAQNVGANQGYNFAPQFQSQQGILNGRQTQNPLPFNEYFQKTANFIGVVSSLDPELYNRNEQVHSMMQQMAPEAVRALKTQDLSLYLGVPDDFFVNRVNIALQRKRENDVYAFK